MSEREAIFSEDRKYRYSLRIRWDNGPLVQFIGLNPSTADETNPVGEEGNFFSVAGNEFANRNDFYLYISGLQCPTKIACWGTHGKILCRAAKVKQWLTGLSCLAKTKGGFPQHPLYLRKDLKPVPYP